MSNSRWLRLNIDWDDSPWVFTLSPECQLVWIKLLCHVKRDGAGGKVKALAPLVAARKWGVGEESVVKMIQAGINEGAIVFDGKTWRISSWDKYQGSDPTNAERQRRYRKNRNKTEEVFSRDGNACVICSSTDDLVVDHVKPVSAGGDTALSNLQTLCRSCNARKRDRYGDNAVTNVVPVRATETETETIERDTNVSPKKTGFRRPTVDECRNEAKARGLPPSEGERFFDFYEAKGWMVGKTKMQKWKSAMANWARGYFDRNPKTESDGWRKDVVA